MRKVLSKWLAPSLVLVVALWVASPFFDPRLIHGNDTLSHYYTLVQLDELLGQGIVYSRWFPYKASGFGAPFFQYYAPLAFYLAQGFVVLGLTLLEALRIAWGLAIVGAALGMFLWVRDILDDGPAVVAAVAYVCAPYVLHNTYSRGGFTEQVALMLMPLVLWSMRRLALSGRWPYLLAGALSYAALQLAHTLSALTFTPAALAYGLVLAWECRRAAPESKRWRRVLGRLALMAGLGLGLSAFFWLPAFVERGYLMTTLISANPAVDYHHNFVPLTKLFSLPLSYRLAPSLGLVALVLAVVGVVAQARGATGLERPGEVWLAVAVLLACVLLALPFAVVLWDAVPLLRLFQFPHRFLSLATLFLAFLAGLGVQGIIKNPKGFRTDASSAPLGFGVGEQAVDKNPKGLGKPLGLGVVILTVALLWAQTLVVRRIHYYQPLPEIDVDFVMEKLRETAPILGKFRSAYTPRWVQEEPPFDEMARDGPDRLDLRSLPEGAAALAAEYSPLRYDLLLTSPEPFSARFRTFFFPGWRAELDGERTEIQVADPYGQISVPLPAGEHRLAVWFGTTAVRTVATALTLLSIGLLLLSTLLLWRTGQRREGGERTR